jgi:hypothetical protein
MTTNHDHLREVAERATPIYTDLLGDRYFNDDYSHATLNVQQDDFISTLNPATVISLLDELAALRKENEGLRSDRARVANVVRQMRNCAHDVANKKLLTGKWASDTLTWFANETGVVASHNCGGCYGHGEVGGLTPQGYETEPCPYCSGTGAEQDAARAAIGDV